MVQVVGTVLPIFHVPNWILRAIVIVLAAAAVVFVFVAASSGHLRLPEGRLSRAVSKVSRHLNGKGEVPAFLERLDER